MKKLRIFWNKVTSCLDFLWYSRGPEYIITYRDKKDVKEDSVTYLWDDESDYNVLRRMIGRIDHDLYTDSDFINKIQKKS